RDAVGREHGERRRDPEPLVGQLLGVERRSEDACLEAVAEALRNVDGCRQQPGRRGTGREVALGLHKEHVKSTGHDPDTSRSRRCVLRPGLTPPGRSRRTYRRCASERCDVARLQTLGSFGDLELDFLTLVEVAVPGSGDRGEVDENVRPSTILRDEAEALLAVEPFDCAGCHGAIPPSSALCRTTGPGPY